MARKSLLTSRRSRRRASLLVVAGGAVAAILVGCAPTADPSPTPDDGAQQTITTFVEALSQGAAADALEVTTAAASEFPCTSMVSNDAGIIMAAPEVRTVEVNGERATAEVVYRSPGEQTEIFDLVQEDGRWLVELPESFTMTIGFDAPVVAELVIDEDCRIPVDEAQMSVRAWPGSYRLDIVDPSGVLDRTEQGLYFVPGGEVTGIEAPVTALPAVPEGSLSVLQSAASSLLVDALDTCVAADLTGSHCPAALAGSARVEGAEPSGEYMIVDRVWTSDGRQWQFETRPGTLEVETGDGREAVEFRYSGTLSADAQGELAVQFGA